MILQSTMIQNQLPLIHGLIDAFLFFETAGPKEVDPDLAVRTMENMSASLLELDDADQLVLRSKLVEIAQNSGDRKYSDFVRNLPDMIGLAGCVLE